MDLTGSLTASGGVGALLQLRDDTQAKTLLPGYDGNGNLVALADADAPSLSLQAAYDYSAFGELLASSGSYSTDNPFRFSTKFHDDESGLVYYGHRYYRPSLGRFINRDPIGESGGVNLYAFCRNNSVNAYDYLGMNTVWLLDGSGGEGTPEDPQSKIQAWLDSQQRTSRFNNFVNNSAARMDGFVGAPNNAGSATGGQYSHTNADGTVVLTPFVTTVNRTQNGVNAVIYAGPTQWGSAPNSGIDLRTPQQRAADESYAREVAMGRGAAGQSAFGDMSSGVVRLDPFVVTASRVADVALFVGGVFFEPLDWAATAREIYNEPRNPWSYAGLIPIVPAGVGKLGKLADKIHDLPGSGPDWIKLKAARGGRT